jgi:hypothetical protein
MSPETAALVSDWANILLVVSLIVGVLSTYAIFVAGNVKEAALKQQVADTNAEAARANEASAKAFERTASLEAEAARLRLELEREIQKGAPRTLSKEQRSALLEELAGKISKLHIAVQQQLESRRFAWEIVTVLNEAGIRFTWIDLPPADTLPVAAGLGLFMYSPVKAQSEDDLKADPLYRALKRANLYGGFAAVPLASPGAIWSPTEKGLAAFRDRLPENEHILYVFEKTPW